MSAGEIVIGPGNPLSPGATALLQAHHALMQSLFPAESNHYLGAEALTAPDIRFLLATRGDTALGCGALAIREGYGEVKSMFVSPQARGTGLAARLLAEIERLARAEGLPALMLETGDTLDAAQRLYLRAGFTYCEAFGPYTPDPRSRYMEKRLAP